MLTTNLFVIVHVKKMWTGGSFRILLPFFWTSWGVGFLNSAIFKLIRMLEWNTKHFPLNLQSGLTLSNFRDAAVGLNSETRYATARVCIKRNLYLINYNRMRTQLTTKWKSRRRFFLLMRTRTLPIPSEFRGGGGWTPQTPPLGTPLLTTYLVFREF